MARCGGLSKVRQASELRFLVRIVEWWYGGHRGRDLYSRIGRLTKKGLHCKDLTSLCGIIFLNNVIDTRYDSQTKLLRSRIGVR